jgi:hypothetical protein
MVSLNRREASLMLASLLAPGPAVAQGSSGSANRALKMVPLAVLRAAKACTSRRGVSDIMDDASVDERHSRFNNRPPFGDLSIEERPMDFTRHPFFSDRLRTEICEASDNAWVLERPGKSFVHLR